MNNFNLKSLTLEQRETRRRILEISFERKFSHIGSCLGAVDLIDAVYKVKKKGEKFVLSNGHAGIALYTILEKYGFITPDITKDLHIHPDRNPNFGIDVSTGSLGQGLPIALGLAIANREENVYCLISDGECAEGSIWETLKILADNHVANLKIMVNANGWSGYGSVDAANLAKRFEGFGYKICKINGHDMDDIIQALSHPNANTPMLILANTASDQFSFLKGLDAHYYIMNDSDYKKALELLE